MCGATSSSLIPPRQFYTAPTAIRLLRRLGEQHVKGHDLSSLRTIGSVGEPINPEAWEWYWEHVGNKECAVVDTYWQTETGSIIITCVLLFGSFHSLLIPLRSPLPGDRKSVV